MGSNLVAVIAISHWLTVTKIDSPKFFFSWNKKLFVNENVAIMNENLPYHVRKVKWSGLVNSYFTRDGVVHIKMTVNHKKFIT